MKNINLKQITLFVFALFACVILYLFVLNGRYQYLSGRGVLDKWKGQIVYAGSDELPVVVNGEVIKNKE